MKHNPGMTSLDKQKRKQSPRIARSWHWSLKLSLMWAGIWVILIMLFWIYGESLPEILLFPSLYIALFILNLLMIIIFHVAAVIIVAGALWHYYRARDGWQTLFTVLITILTVPVTYLLFIIGIEGHHVVLQHHTTINDKNYSVGYLILSENLDGDYAPYVIYQCDAFRIYCRLIEQGETTFRYNNTITDDGEQISIPTLRGTITYRPD